jgi:hypothetical protein
MSIKRNQVSLLLNSASRPRKYTDSRGSRMRPLLPLYDSKSESIQIDEKAFWKIAKESISKKAIDNDLTTWYSKPFDLSKTDIKKDSCISNY